MPVGFFSFQSAGSIGTKPWEGHEEVRAVPISALLARIRTLIPAHYEDHYEEIVRGFGNGALRPPVKPMSDRELSRVIADFLKDAPSVDSIGTLGRRLDPSTPL
jgi:hypothetical protein